MSLEKKAIYSLSFVKMALGYSQKILRLCGGLSW